MVDSGEAARIDGQVERKHLRTSSIDRPKQFFTATEPVITSEVVLPLLLDYSL